MSKDQATGVTNSTTVMLVEDDPLLREVIALALEDHGMTVMLAEDGHDALRQLRATQPLPVLILLDLAMPAMDGRQFRAAQLGDPDLAVIPIIVLSGHEEAREAAQQMGAAAWLWRKVVLLERASTPPATQK